MAPLSAAINLASVSIFPVLILALLAEEFSRVQLGKSAKTAVDLTSETVLLSLISYLFLTLPPVRQFAILNPEALLIGTALVNLVVGRYVGLRLLEYIRFRKFVTK